MQGAQISAGGDADLVAERKIHVGAVETGKQYSAPGAATDVVPITHVFGIAVDKKVGTDLAKALAGPIMTDSVSSGIQGEGASSMVSDHANRSL